MSKKKPLKCDICGNSLLTDYYYSFKLQEENWAELSHYKINLCEKCYKNMVQYCIDNIERSEKE